MGRRACGSRKDGHLKVSSVISDIHGVWERLRTVIAGERSPRVLADSARRGTRRAAARHADPARASAVPAGTVVKVARAVDADGNVELAVRKVKIGTYLARGKVTLRFHGHLAHAIREGVVAKTMPAPVHAEDRAELPGARIADAPLPSRTPGRSASSRVVSLTGK
jgi:hypothetical protein